MSNKYHLLSRLILLVFIISGCSKDSDQQGSGFQKQGKASIVERNFSKYKSRWESLNNNLSECSYLDSSTQDPFYCMQLACENAGGIFDQILKKCDCSKNSDGFFIFTADAGGLCLPPLPKSYDGKFRKSFVAQFINDEYLSTSFFESIEKLSEKELKGKTLNIPFSVLTKLHYYFINNKQSVDLALANIESSYELLSSPGFESIGSTQVEYLYDEIQKKFAIYTGSYKKNADIFLSTDMTNPKLLKVKELYERFRSSQIEYSNIISRTDLGCLEECYAEKIMAFNDSYVIERDLFVKGTLFKRAIYLSSTPEYVNATSILVLDGFQNVNLIYLLNHENPQPGIVKIYADIYKRDASLFAENIRLYDSSSKLEKVKELGYPNGTVPEMMVTVCEQGVSPFAFSKENYSRLVFGPYAGQIGEFSGSIWGWDENEGNSPYDYSIGAFFFSEHGYVNKAIASMQGTHHEEVISAALQSSDQVTVTALDYRKCTSQNTEDNPLLNEEFPGHVVNVSAKWGGSGEYCNEKLAVMEKIEDRVMWVFSAGNTGGDILESCEKLMMNKINGISVGAIDPLKPNVLEVSSSRGMDVLTASFRTAAGTSFAAPVISTIVAELMESHPRLTISHVKRSIYLGVEFLGIEVFSGGRTIKEKVMKVGSFFDKEPNLSDLEVLERLYDINNADLVKKEIFKKHVHWLSL